MDFWNQFKYLLADLRRWKVAVPADFFYALFEQGVWAAILYRFSRAFYVLNIPGLKLILRLLGFFLMKFSEVFLGAAIKPAADIGPGLYIGHSGMIIIHPEAVIGKNLSIGPGVIIGQKGLGEQGVPVIGDDVYVGTGAKILGRVTIGSRVRIGANAVVLEDIPEGATAIGVPARVIKRGEL
jgi:serine O-acetyltransferase